MLYCFYTDTHFPGLVDGKCPGCGREAHDPREYHRHVERKRDARNTTQV